MPPSEMNLLLAILHAFLVFFGSLFELFRSFLLVEGLNSDPYSIALELLDVFDSLPLDSEIVSVEVHVDSLVLLIGVEDSDF